MTSTLHQQALQDSRFPDILEGIYFSTNRNLRCFSSSTMTQTTANSWTHNDADSVDCLCLGTGRFLRSVLVPAMGKTALIQSRGRSFLDYMSQRSDPSYEVDTVSFRGDVETQNVPCHGAFTFGTKEGQAAAEEFLTTRLKRISVIGVGVTEAGLSSSSSKGMTCLYKILQVLQSQIAENDAALVCENPHGRICIVDMDNVPNNGQVIQKHMLDLSKDDEAMTSFLQTKVAFLNTMVDRITSQRDGSGGMVPRCEPIPAKALVILDPEGDLPPSWSTMQESHGVVIRTTTKELEQDIELKLRIANGTHTAVAHCMALTIMTQTSVLSSDNGKLLLDYLDALFENQILHGSWRFDEEQVRLAYDDWRRRLCHKSFGLSTFFITQNGAAKGGIRLGPTVQDLMLKGIDISVCMAFSFACILRWLTPTEPGKNGVYRGWLEKSAVGTEPAENETTEYADGLMHNLDEGWYEFRCACKVSKEGATGSVSVVLSDWLGELYEAKSPLQPQAYVDVIRSYLIKSDGGNMAKVAQDSKTKSQFDVFTMSVATFYARMVAGDGITPMLEEMAASKPPYSNGLGTSCNVLTDNPSIANGQPLHYRSSPVPNGSNLLKAPVSGNSTLVSSVIVSEVASAVAIDLHTHLLPPSHGPLCLWGIDELLTYHYLVAEYFMTAPPSMMPAAFFATTKQQQADVIWRALFVDRSPVSEACRGVITTLQTLGLSNEIQARDLEAIRKYYNTNFRNDGLDGTERFSELIYSLSGVRYAIMTNIPFDANEAQYWRPKQKEYTSRYRSALRVDPLLAGDRKTVETSLKASGYEATLGGARQYLRDWCDTMKPEYMMASTPHNFVLQAEGNANPLSGVNKPGVNEDAMKEPFAFVDVANKDTNCTPEEDDSASVIDETSDLLSEVLMKVCEERDLPIALKIGAHRGVNPQLESAGDGVVAFADGGVLARLCSRFPKVRFLATFLSRNNQHEACVLASKFRNLHIYGCWWFCNNPSLIREITQMRVEMLGTAFTAQHSDARVLDQLLYKWSHSRSVIAQVLATEYVKLHESGWTPTRAEIRRDVERLFGGSYEEFMSKSLV